MHTVDAPHEPARSDMESLRLHDVVVFLAAAGLVIPLVKRFAVSPVLGFLLIGLALGPHGLGRLADDQTWLRHFLITDVAGVRALAELGVVFLLFVIGLDLPMERLAALRRLVFGLGTAQIVVTALVIGGSAWVFGQSLAVSAVLGSCLALSSTALVVQLLTEQGRFGTPVGRASFAILLAQDLAVVPILFLVSALGSRIGGSLGASFTLAIAAAAGAVIGLVVVGRLALRPLFRFVGAAKSPELFMAATLLIVIATAAFTELAGLTAGLGAFLAGILLAETEFRHEIEVIIEPFKGLLLGLFFISVGMSIDLTAISRMPGTIGLSVLGLFALKAVIVAVLARGFGLALATAVEMGILLGQGGEFAFVVAALASRLGVLPEAAAQLVLIIVGATLVLTPLAARAAAGVGRRLERRADAAFGLDVMDPLPDLEGHVVIVGYGRTGRLLAEMLEQQRLDHIALDLDPRRVARLRSVGAPVYHGDASHPQLLERVRLSHASSLVVTMDDPGAAEHVVRAARRLTSDLPILVRARDEGHAARLVSHGATRAVPEVLEAGLQLGQLMFEHAGYPIDTARELIERERTARSLVGEKEEARSDPESPMRPGFVPPG